MNLSNKTFTVIFSLLFISTAIMGLLFYYSERSELDSEFINKYSAMTSTIAYTLKQMDQNTDSLMWHSLMYFKAVDKMEGIQSTEKLGNMKKLLQVSDIFLANKDGEFLSVTNNLDPKIIPNLYSMCKSYRQLIFSKNKIAVTPILIAHPKGNGTYKFMMIPNHNNTLILEVGIKLDYIVDLLKQSVLSYPELAEISLFSPNGEILGEYQPNGNMAYSLKDIGNFDVGKSEKVEIRNDVIVIWKEINVEIENCCECQMLSQNRNSNNQKYSYVLRAIVSRQPLFKAVSDLRNSILVILLVILIITSLIARRLSSWLLSKLSQFVNNVENYLSGRLDAIAVRLNSKDEIGFISKIFSEMLLKLESTTQLRIENERLIAQTKILEEKSILASQVSHDIRSPLSALNILLSILENLPEEKRTLMRSAIKRINDIANTLLHAGRNTQSNMVEIESSLNIFMISTLIESILTEKRLQFREFIDIEIESEISKSYGLFAEINYTEFKRLISNLINNSVDAIETKKGEIIVRVSEFQNQILIQIQDNGKGIAPDILANLGQKGISSGKSGVESGFGLGIPHAINYINSIGGKIELNSHLGIGTTISIFLQKASQPDWFVDSLNLGEFKQIVILDDDQSIHNIWKDRFKINIDREKLNIFHFTSGDLFRNWFKDKLGQGKNTLFLIDYELLNQNKNGIEIIEELQIQEQSIIVTSRYEEVTVLNKCKSLKLRLLPKNLTGFVPVKI